ncbi:MAG: hypothetical protein AMXMBFR58_04790 [Phycisphaerae bacterium]|nr:hypothetical protein [Phycisphaerales bacterium]
MNEHEWNKARPKIPRWASRNGGEPFVFRWGAKHGLSEAAIHFFYLRYVCLAAERDIRDALSRPVHAHLFQHYHAVPREIRALISRLPASEFD